MLVHDLRGVCPMLPCESRRVPQVVGKTLLDGRFEPDELDVGHDSSRPLMKTLGSRGTSMFGHSIVTHHYGFISATNRRGLHLKLKR